MMKVSLESYQQDRAHFSVDRETVRETMVHVEPIVIEALGIQVARHVLWDGQLPVYPVITQPETNAGWGELMPHWFKPYERPIPLNCLDNWALFAGLYREGLGVDGNNEHFVIDNLLKVIIASDLMIAFLPSTMGAGHFLRHGALTILLGILWLEEPARDAWLGYHQTAATKLAETQDAFESLPDLDQWLMKTEQKAFLVPEQKLVAGDESVNEFLADTDRRTDYLNLFLSLALSVSSLAHQYGTDWQSWIFQAINVHYRLPDFGLEAIQGWLSDN